MRYPNGSAQQSADAKVGDGVKQPNENADSQHAANHDQSVLCYLLGGGPNDLLQLAAKLAEVSGNGTKGSCEPIFLLSFSHFAASLLRLVVNGVLSAESAVLLHFETVGIVLLVLHGVVVSLLAFAASKGDLYSHFGTSLIICLPVLPRPMRKFSGYRNYTSIHTAVEKWAQKNSPFFTGTSIIPQGLSQVNYIF